MVTIKTIKGCDLALHLAQHPKINEWSDIGDSLHSLFLINDDHVNLVDHPWYKDIIFYL